MDKFVELDEILFRANIKIGGKFQTPSPEDGDRVVELLTLEESENE